ncbi:hypothetical protein DFP72DRAFT_1169793 [Ephemerocybe angulata]|uniref:Uncharacterized protein n=1 Tax=Ephemerocybe angulata TaxID=980116 RepID=A0A8H6M6W8_9AGAR|nr:hypothetical protein DFP72DRAFT_1169793 [Tulosesus angulatus]
MLATKAPPSTVAAFLEASSSSAASRSQPQPPTPNPAASSSTILNEHSSKPEEPKNPARLSSKVTKTAQASAKKEGRVRINRFREALAAMTPEGLQKRDEVLKRTGELVVLPRTPLAVHLLRS